MEMPRRDFIKGSVGAGASLGVSPLLARAFAPSSSSDRPAAADPTPGQPVLFFPPAKVDALRSRIAKDPAAQARWTKFVQRADALVGGGRQGGSGASGLTLALAWRMTADERYAKRLRESLLASIDAKQWGGQEHPQPDAPVAQLPGDGQFPGQLRRGL